MLATRIEQAHPLACEWVTRLCAALFVTIAWRTSQTQILGSAFAVRGVRCDVIYGVFLSNEQLGCLAVLATPFGALTHSFT
jgi:hypothetical protein